MRDSAFLSRMHREPPPLLLEVEQNAGREGIRTVDRAAGRFLSVLVHCMQANRILELGTGIGLSTLWMGLALPPAGRIWTIDPDMARTKIADAYFRRAGLTDRIEIVNQPPGEMLEWFPQRNLDIVLIDGYAADYAGYLDAVVPMLKRSGIVVVDGLHAGENSASPRAFLNHPQLDATVVPLGEGMGIGARVD